MNTVSGSSASKRFVRQVADLALLYKVGCIVNSFYNPFVAAKVISVLCIKAGILFISDWPRVGTVSL